jgi:hypothetical protein
MRSLVRLNGFDGVGFPATAGDFDLAGFACFSHWDAEQEYAAIEVSGQLNGVQVLPQEELPAEVARGSFVDYELIAVFMQWFAVCPHGDHVAFYADLDVSWVNTGHVHGDQEPISAAECLHGQGSRAAAVGESLLGQPLEITEGVEVHQRHNCASLWVRDGEQEL